MTPAKVGWILGAVAVIATLAAILTAFVISEIFEGEGEDPNWLTYRNDVYGFEVEYPDDWHTLLRENGVTLSKRSESHKGPHVLAYSNFQGDWCLRGRLEDREIEVSGVTGVETSCYDCEADAPEPACPEEPHSIVRVFGNIGVMGNYVVLGDARGDIDTVRRIVESFRFTD